MADLSDINIGINVEAGDVTKAISKFESFKRKTAQLKLELDKGNISTKAYNRGVDQMARELGKVTGNINQAKSAMYKYQFAIKDATEEQLRFTTASGKGMRRMEVLAQQAGYQIGDLAVQIQGGTNAAVALGQQGSQLLGFFGPYGALAGAALAIGTGLIAPFIRAGKEVETFAEEAQQALQDVKDKIDELETGRNSILRGYDEETARLRVLGREQADALQAKIDTINAQGLAAGDAELYSRREREALRNTFDAINANLAKRKEYSDELEKLTKTEEQKKAEGKVSPEEKAQRRLNKSRWAAFQAQMAASKKLKDEADKIKAVFEEQSRILGDQIALEAMRKQFGSESFVIQRLQNDIALDNYEVELRRQGLSEKMIASLVEQKSVALGLKQEMIEVAALAQTTLNFAPTQELASRLRKYAGRGTVSDKDPIFGTGSRAGKSIYDEPPKAPKDPVKQKIKDLSNQLDLETQLIGKFGEQRDLQNKLIQARQQYSDVATPAQMLEIENTIKAIDAMEQKQQALEDIKDKYESIGETIAGSMDQAFMSVVTDIDILKDSFEDMAFKVDRIFQDMARDIIAHLYQVLVVQKMVRGLGGMLSGSSNPVLSAIGGGLESYDGGGYTGSGSRSGGLDGKGGFMAMLHPRETVVDHTKGQGVGGEVINVTQNINVSTGVQQTVRTEIKQLMPQIADSAKAAVVDAKRRGGSYGRAFS
jgi:hypothetical protein